MAFKLNLEVQDIDTFFTYKIHKKFKFWSTIHLLLANRNIIVNVTLNSML
jgi:hypothetical protein